MLTSVKAVFDALEKSRIPWCHWKSNASLDRAVAGDTDLDLLFQSQDKGTLEHILEQLGAVKFQAVKELRYPDIDDFLSVDNSEGVLVHFHVHYQLDIGEKRVKSYRLPFVDEILSSRIRHPTIDCWISRPEIELILLILRQALRIPPLSPFRNRLPTIGQATQVEFAWLKSRIVPRELSEIGRRWFGPKTAEAILTIVDNGITMRRILDLRRVLRPAMKSYRRMSSAEVLFRLVAGSASLRIKKFLSSCGFGFALRRTAIRRGCTVAFTGCDGSGKSSLAQSMYDLFRKKIDVVLIYFGHGASHRSWTLFLYRLFGAAIRRCPFLPRAQREAAGHICFAIGVALNKKKNFHRAAAAKGKGMFVVCDRFPQTTHPGINDGPHIAQYLPSQNRLIQRLARWENRIYSLGETVPPDIIFHIEVDPRIAFHRKNGSTDMAKIQAKIDAFKTTRRPASSSVIEIENNEIPFSELRKTIVRQIWSRIRGTSAAV